MSKIPVLEIFGPTIQGEGMVIGQKTMFIRTAGCDYSCSWCDSAF
ncbi:7-carboxy-7-deazaguanine synthase QueE, partial [Bacillus cereus]